MMTATSMENFWKAKHSGSLRQFALIPAIAAALLLLGSLGLSAQSLFERGQQAFLANDLEEALPLLEAARNTDPSRAETYAYLAVGYTALGRGAEAERVLQAGVTAVGARSAEPAFNLGVILQTQGRQAEAASAYSQAITLRPDYAAAYLNRANANLEAGELLAAADDYSVYLSLEPGSPQAPTIRELISLLRGDVAAAEEAARARAEAEARDAERLAELERQREAEAAARREALLSNVLNSLSTAASDEANNIGAGSAGAQDEDEVIGRAD